MTDLARRLIAENKRTKATFLDLGNCGLYEIPEEVGELEWLESISFARQWYERTNVGWERRETANSGRENHIAQVSAITALPRLRSLVLAHTTIRDLDSLCDLVNLQSLHLSGTRVVDVSPLSQLSSLQFLDLSGTRMVDVSPLSQLSSLQSLDLSGTRVVDVSSLSQLSFLQSLGLSGTRVDVDRLSQLSSLRSLDLSGTRVTDLSPLSQLSFLQSLDLSGTRVVDVSPLSQLSFLQSLDLGETQVADVSPLSQLSFLQSLRFSFTRVVDVRPLSQLSSLQSLSLMDTQVTDLSPLSQLTSLQSLNLSRTQVTDLNPLSQLSVLQLLSIDNTRVADLSPLSQLSALQSLSIVQTQVTDLSPLRTLITQGCPVQWSFEYWNGPGIYVEGCPLVNPPPEIVQQGNEAILNYFRERDAGEVDHLYEAKMLILGEGGAGKTSLLRRLYQSDQPLPKENETTRGIDIHQHEFPLKNGRTFRLNVWDFGGQEIYHATHQFFLTHRSLYVLLDDTRKDHKSVSDPGFKEWLELVEVFGDESPVLIFQNEKDGRSKAIDLAGIRARFGNVKERYAGNLEHADAADKLRNAIEHHVTTLSHIGEELPARWLQVRADIERRAAETPHISQNEYFEIYERHLEFDRTRALHLSRYLHDLGVFLHFQDDPLLRRTVILQNEWATDAVYCILDDEPVKAARGRFTDADCARAWADSKYVDMHLELQALMQRFELCYQLLDSQPTTWLAPQLLPPTTPDELQDWGKPGDLVLRYRYGFLPKGILSRLIVRLHRFVEDPERAWTTGVCFTQEDTEVLAQVLPNGDEIELRARGPEHKALLSVVTSELDALNQGLPGLRDKITKLVPCHCSQCQSAVVPEFFQEAYLRRRKRDGRLQIECPKSYDDVSVLELLDGLRVEHMPSWVHPSPAAVQVRRVKIFLASSVELREDRDTFDLYLRQLSDTWKKRGIEFVLERWEHFLDAMSRTGLQDEYNQAVRECDVFVSLFHTKVGQFTEEEFDTAWGQFLKADKPRIHTYFKQEKVALGKIPREHANSLWSFRDKLQQLGHYPTDYDDIEHLKRKFRDQLDRLFDE